MGKTTTRESSPYVIKSEPSTQTRPRPNHEAIQSDWYEGGRLPEKAEAAAFPLYLGSLRHTIGAWQWVIAVVDWS